jgi:hypothetical protein
MFRPISGHSQVHNWSLIHIKGEIYFYIITRIWLCLDRYWFNFLNTFCLRSFKRVLPLLTLPTVSCLVVRLFIRSYAKVSNELPWCSWILRTHFEIYFRHSLPYLMGGGDVLLSHLRDTVALSEVHFVCTSPDDMTKSGSTPIRCGVDDPEWGCYGFPQSLPANGSPLADALHLQYWSRDSVVGIATKLRAGRSGVPIPAGSRAFCRFIFSYMSTNIGSVTNQLILWSLKLI